MTGVDPAAAAIESAREHVRQKGLAERATFMEGSAYDLSAFPAASFDGVLMADVLEHLLDLPAAVREAPTASLDPKPKTNPGARARRRGAQVTRVLRPGGVLAFDTINRTFKSYLGAIVLAEEARPPHLAPPPLRTPPRAAGRADAAAAHARLAALRQAARARLPAAGARLAHVECSPGARGDARRVPGGVQAHGLRVDSSTFRGMAPTPSLDPRHALRLQPAHALAPVMQPELVSEGEDTVLVLPHDAQHSTAGRAGWRHRVTGFMRGQMALQLDEGPAQRLAAPTAAL